MNTRDFLRLGASLLVVAIITGSLFLVRSHVSTSPDFVASSSSQSLVIEVPAGATGSDIAHLLATAGIVKSYSAFFKLAVSDSRSSQVAPGAHRLDIGICAKCALDQLLDGKRIPNLVKVAEGAWTSEIAKELVDKGWKKSDVEMALTRISIPSVFSGTEGVLFPAQYSFATGTSAMDVLQSMTTRFATEAASAGITSATPDLSPMALLTIASIIQAEGDAADFTKISRVIRNRLKLGMQLQLDTTVHYILKSRGHVFLSTAATQVASPYNTYRHFGLPPGPIGNPGKAAMIAAVNPAQGDWIYFITVKPGDTRFTQSDKEFLTWKSEYEKNLRAGAFGATQ